MVEQADAMDLKSIGLTLRTGSSPVSGTKIRVNSSDFTLFCYLWELFGNQKLTFFRAFQPFLSKIRRFYRIFVRF